MNLTDDLKVLLVDDKSFVRNMIERVLNKAGIETVLQAGNGKEAIEMISLPDTEIDLVMTDLLMPDMDGIEMVRFLASVPDCPPIVFMTGADPALLTTAERVAAARGLTVVGSLENPVGFDGIQTMLDRFSRARTEGRGG